ncbi:unnamed protein product, partial [Vitis vinifera]|uniref:Uncharacterized protein n=1 Tax=Vitis vinifera TaxID=29760 RepID=D7TU41_VITVI
MGNGTWIKGDHASTYLRGLTGCRHPTAVTASRRYDTCLKLRDSAPLLPNKNYLRMRIDNPRVHIIDHMTFFACYHLYTCHLILLCLVS